MTARGLTYGRLIKPARRIFRRLLARGREEGYVLILGMLVVLVLLLLGGALLLQVQRNQQHVQRDRAYTQSLAIAEAGLNQYLWMVASGTSSEVNDFEIPGASPSSPNKMTFLYTDPSDGTTKGEYTTEVTPPSASDPNITVRVTGISTQPVEQSRTVAAHLGRPAFSEYILLTDEEVWIDGGPTHQRQWWGKTHSNQGVRIDTNNITELITCAVNQQNPSPRFGGKRNGVWSSEPGVPSSDVAHLWVYPVGPVPFETVTADFVKLSTIASEADDPDATGVNIPYSTATSQGSSAKRQGWYIKLLPNAKYQVRQVTDEYESASYKNNNDVGGYLTLNLGAQPFGISNNAYNYPEDGVIFVNDDVWVDATGGDIEGRLTIASSGQLNPSGKNTATSIHIISDITYKNYDGTVALGLIAQDNIEIPAYAPWQVTSGPPNYKVSTVDMRFDGAVIAQYGREYVRSAETNGPLRDNLYLYGSISSYKYPYRYNGSNGGFVSGSNEYDFFMLHNPPPYFPTTGTYQILDWQELSSSMAVEP